MHKFEILDKGLDVFQSRFLEASAGTGKTFAIEHLFVRLLLESEDPISLSEILAVTFTREAAHEMKARIRQNLLSFGKEDHPRVRRALALFDEIQVFTIHGFCHRMLTEYAFEAKAPLKLSSPDRPDYLTEMRKTVEDFFHTGDCRFAFEITALLKQSRFDLDQLIEKVVMAMQAGPSPKEVSLPEMPKISLEHLRADVEMLAIRYKRLKKEEWECQLEPFAAFLQEQKPALLFEEKEWFFEKMHEGNAKIKAPPLEILSLKEPIFFERLEKQFLPQLAILRDRSEMISRVASECRKRWECKASRHDHFTFDDLLHQMKEALQEPSFKQKVRERYKAVIVDEFQDTDPIQWSIFKDLCLESHLLYLVGDPKQSIYGFRSADIYTYMDAANHLGPKSKAYLDTNYRSSPPLIEALNDLFTKCPDWIALPSLPGALEYHPVKAGRDAAKIDEPPITLFGARGEMGRERSFPTKKMEEELLFPYIASEIIRLSDKIPFSQMCVLIKDRYHAQRLQIHLNKWKIPSTIKRTFNLTKSRGFLEVELFLEALLHPEKESEVKAAMRMDEGNPFYDLRVLFEEKGFAPCFAHYVARITDHTLYAEMKQTAELLIEEKGASLPDLLLHLRALKGVSPELDPRLKLRGEEGEEKVPIMTTFASKGLEFDVVFALGMAYRQKEENVDPERDAEKMRQLYVAFTRPREKLYIPYVTESKSRLLSPSPIELFFREEPEGVEWIEPIPISRYRAKKTAQVLIPPPEVDLSFDKEYLTSFSSMAKPHTATLLGERFQAQDFTFKTPHTLPLGAETGILLHAIFEAHFLDRMIPIEQIIFETLNGTHLEGWEQTVSDMVIRVLDLPLMPNFTLNTLGEGEYFPEMEFLFPKEGSLVKGFADLVFKQNDTFYLLDWKTNWVGPSDADYTEENLKQVMTEHDYYLQANLYAEAITRYVKRLYKNPKFGGAYYLFVRGNKAVHFGTS